jgi:hypothetical protein
MSERIKPRIEKCSTNSIHINLIKEKSNTIDFKLRLNGTNIGKYFSDIQGNEESAEKHDFNVPASSSTKQMLKLSHIISDATWLRDTMENEMATPDKYLDYHQVGFRTKNLDVPRVLTITLEDDEVLPSDV